MGDDDEISNESIKELVGELKAIPPKKVAVVILLCLFFLIYYLGFIVGFNRAYSAQEDYYKLKEAKYCTCFDNPIYQLKNEPLKLPDFNSIEEKEK